MSTTVIYKQLGLITLVICIFLVFIFAGVFLLTRKKLKDTQHETKMLMGIFDTIINANESLITRRFENFQEQLDYALNESLKLTDSKFGYIYYYSEERAEFTLNSWTNGVMADCKILERQATYELHRTGIWGEVVHQKKPIIVNDFERSNPLKRGYPEGHIVLKKFMSVPVFNDEKIVAVVGHANKETDYNDNDIYGMTIFMTSIWNDIERRKANNYLEYLCFHDVLTGLYNRRFFEEELRRLNTERNLPVSLIMGDVNGLKLTNDIFGHAEGDILLKKVSEVLKRVCRSDDVISRWGGDEFAILLPSTNLSQAEKIIARIKSELMNESVKAIQCSISMGAATKEDMRESLLKVLVHAEEKMYAVKNLERSGFKSDVINTIIDTLHNKSRNEKIHALRVSELTFQFGEKLGLSEERLHKLKEAAYLHDIGKIVLDEKLLNHELESGSPEWLEMRKHAITGYRILNSFEDTMYLGESVLAHHEQWDGNGYPKGLKGEEIPLLARIISVVEEYEEALYDFRGEVAMSETEALQHVRELAGTRLDPNLVDLFTSMFIENKS